MSSSRESINPTPDERVLPPLFRTINSLVDSVVALSYAASHDSLTGLLNKEAWKHEINERLGSDKPFGIIFMDMDAFKAVNDNMGHETGDRLLRDFGDYLQRRYRREGEEIAHESLVTTDQGTAGRYGGDEFGLIVDLSDRSGSLSLNECLDKTLAYLNEGVDEFVENQDPRIHAQKFHIAVGGVAWQPGTKTTVSDLLAQADAAMYDNKQSHR